MTFDQLPELYNYIEVGLWPTMGLTVGIYGLTKRGPTRRDCLLAAGILVIFGASDWFEANTGNEWWHPWWLCTWKVVCVVALFGILLRAHHRRRISTDTTQPAH